VDGLQLRREAKKGGARADRLAQVSWAAEIVKRASKPTAAEGDLFELRFAFELSLVGIEPRHAFKTGVGNSDVDFRFDGQPSWNLELFSLQESEVVKSGTESSVLAPGLSVESLLLWETKLNAQELGGRHKQTPGHELQRLVQRMETKLCTETRQPTKFPIPDELSGNALLVDVRSYIEPDRQDCKQAACGPSNMRPEYVLWVGDEPVKGMFQSDNNRPAAHLARKRLHLLGFVHEEDFADAEIRQAAVGSPTAGLMESACFHRSQCRQTRKRRRTDAPTHSGGTQNDLGTARCATPTSRRVAMPLLLATLDASTRTAAAERRSS
jgi:hypothetical protein